jgi:hypothetical protein
VFGVRLAMTPTSEPVKVKEAVAFRFPLERAVPPVYDRDLVVFQPLLNLAELWLTDFADTATVRVAFLP